MVISKWTYSITHYDRSNSWASQSLDSVFISIPIFTDTSDGSVNSGVLKIDANLGHYIRDARSGEFNFPTKIDIYDRIKILVDDGYGNQYTRYFDVTKKTPAKDNRNGTTLQLTLTGIEHWLQKINYSKQTFALTARELLNDLIAVYNANKTPQMPTFTVTTNELPPIYASLDWGVNEDSIYNRLMELVDSLGASAANGGVLDYFDVNFVHTSVSTVNINIFSSGNTTGGKPSITVDGNTSTLQSDGGLSPIEGTLITGWGASDGGSLPTNFSKWTSKRILMPSNTESLYPIWVNDYKYKKDSIVRYKASNIYETYQLTSGDIISLPATAPNISGSGWTKLTTWSYYGNSIVYSPWTKSKSAYWKNSAADPSGSGGSRFGTAMIDGNLVVNDETTTRTWVDVIATSDTGIDLYWLYGSSTSGVYDGLRVLVRGTGSGAFSGFTNHVIEYRDGSWVKKYAPANNLIVACINNARVYAYNSSTSTWDDKSNTPNWTDCFHPVDSDVGVANSMSVFTDPDTGLEYTANSNSSIKVKYTWSPLDDWQAATWIGDNLDYYKAGAWLTLRFPLPINSYNSAGNIGSAYGGTASIKAPTTVDTQNMDYSHDGKRGFNNGDSSEDLGPIQAISFWMYLWFAASSDAGYITIDAGDFKMRCVVTDLNDNVAYQDFIIPFNSVWSSITLPISGFQITRNHRPRKIEVGDYFPVQGLDISTQFEWRHLKMITFQTQESYDDFGRYYAGNGRFGLQALGSFIGGIPSPVTKMKIELFLDAFRFTKPLLVNSGQVTSGSDVPLVVEPDFLQRPDIFLYDQLKADVLSELDRSMHPPEEFVISTEGKFDINYGDYFYYTDPETVDRVDSADNKIKLVAKHIEYSITKPVDGEGGFVRTIRGVRRFV